MREDAQDHEARGISRRNALRAGVAAGAGAVVWSGVSITSLGGTPAYAEGCTFKSTFTLANCRNTDQGTCPGSEHDDIMAYHPLDTSGLPAGYGLTYKEPILNSGTCCTAFPGAGNPVFTFPTTVKCLVHFDIYSTQAACAAQNAAKLDYSFVYPWPGGVPTDSGSITIDLSCPPQQGQAGGKNMANDFWSIIVVCNSKAAPDSCYTTS